MHIGRLVSDSINASQFRYYHFRISTSEFEGVTIQVRVSHGGVWCYVSYITYNPHSGNYSQKFFTSSYNESYVNLRGTYRHYFFVAIEGVEVTNDFSLNSTLGRTISGALLIAYGIAS